MSASDTFDISVVIPTYNRAPSVRRTLESVLRQDAGSVRFEVVVVDNNSSDDTRTVIEDASQRAGGVPLRYVFEPRQGVSHARNTGVERSSAPIIAFIDDDVVASRTWVQRMKAAFDAHPDADCIGGRVKPIWTNPPPDWWSPYHAGAIALQDRPAAAWLDRDHASACLLGANLACRRRVFSDVGGFSPDYPRGQDRELQMRLWRAGKRGLYLPDMDLDVEIPPERLTKRYHRRWHRTTAHYHALMRYRDTIDPDGRIIDENSHRRLCGTPLFLYRDCLTHAIGWLGSAITRRPRERFFHETRLWYGASFLVTRYREQRRARR